jgi:hypothetical protein
MNIRVIIRKFQSNDREYEALAQIYRAAVRADEFGYHEYISGPEFRAADELLRAAGIPFRRYVAEETGTGRIVGYAQFHHAPDASDPLGFVGVIRMHPDYQSREVEGRLSAQLRDDLDWLDTILAQAGIFSHQRKGIAFPEKWGLYQDYRHISLLRGPKLNFRLLAFEKKKRDPILRRQRDLPSTRFERPVRRNVESYIQ